VEKPAKSTARPPRTEPREIVELRRIRDAQPDLAEAVDLQIALVELQRRVQGRVALPWIEVNPAWLADEQQAGRPLLRFEDIPLDWTDFRLMLRETGQILERFGQADASDLEEISKLLRTDGPLTALVAHWFNVVARREPGTPDDPQIPRLAETLGPALAIAMRPFLSRSAEAVLSRISLDAWSRGYCPLCGGEPEFAEITPAAERMLICGRCGGKWPHHPFACPFCDNTDRTRITSFASRDGRYRLFACDVCRRYLKAFDGRHGQRPAMMPADTVATLPLDAAALQKGYRG
jgi:FdhE protein